MTSLTIFSAPKPFTNAHIAKIQRNAIRSWKILGLDVEVILFGQEEGLAEAAVELGVRHIAEVGCNDQGTPLINSMFAQVRTKCDSPLLAFINADILVFSDLLRIAQRVSQRQSKFLIVGQRWDLEVEEELVFPADWEAVMRQHLKIAGKLHPPTGSDFFIFPRTCFQVIPNLAVGRAGWDNWMIYEARQQGWHVIDATGGIDIIHQSHDYSHLPGGQPHYRLPETSENVRLAGGKRHIFHLIDCDRILQYDKINPYPLTWQKFWREIEIFPLIGLHSELLGQLFFAIIHPIKAYREWRAKLGKKEAPVS
jgi:hypothetical protein